MTFEEAVDALLKGKVVQRKEYNIAMYCNGTDITRIKGFYARATYADIVAEDWEIVCKCGSR